MGKNEAGNLVLVVGPSGAGKDTLLAHAADQLVDDTRFIFPRRLVTRAANADIEDHDCLTPEEFERVHESGDCTLSWQAHGLGYVIPNSVMDEVRAGHIAICNGSRRVLPAARARYPDCQVITIEADRQTRARRLAARGRESEADIKARLNRDVPIDVPGANPLIIDNSGVLRDSVETMVDALLSMAGDSSGLARA